MAANVKKPAAAKKPAAKPAGKATQARAGAGPAVAERSKDAKRAFGKAAPKKVELTSENAAPTTRKPSAPKRAAAKTLRDKHDGTETGGGSVVAKVARAAKTTAAVAVGAVVATARLAKPSRKRKDDETAK